MSWSWLPSAAWALAMAIFRLGLGGGSGRGVGRTRVARRRRERGGLGVVLEEGVGQRDGLHVGRQPGSGGSRPSGGDHAHPVPTKHGDQELEELVVGLPGEVDVLEDEKDGTVLRDALQSEDFRAALLQLMAGSGERTALHGAVKGDRGHAMPPTAGEGIPSRLLSLEQSNSSLNFGEQVFVKLFRKLEDGLNPDVEITRFLSEKRGFAQVPPYAGAIAYERPRREAQILALALGLLGVFFERWLFFAEARHAVIAYYGR